MHFARTHTLIAMAVIINVSNLTGGLVEAKPSKGCNYWCKDGIKYYCCSNGKKSTEILSWLMEEMVNWHDYFWFFVNPWPAIFQRTLSSDWTQHDYHHTVESHEREGTCPEIRPFCPRTQNWDEPPRRCDVDNECYHLEKCCYDTCLDHKTCKPSVITHAIEHY